MKRWTIIVIGTLVTGLAALGTVQASDLTGYTHIRAMTLFERMDNEAELFVEHYIPLVMQQQWEWEVDREDIDQAIRGEYNRLCGGGDEDINAEGGEEQTSEMTYSECFDRAKEIRALADRESWLRALGRELQILASGYEIGMAGYTGRTNDLVTDTTEIGKIWQSGVDAMTNPVNEEHIREEDWSSYLSQEEQDEIEKNIGKALLELVEKDPDATKKEVPSNNALFQKYFAAGWRYRHGLKAAQDDETSCDDPGDGTELELVNKRWCALEEALQELVDKLPEEWDPPLAANERVIFNPLNPQVPDTMRAEDIPFWEGSLMQDTGANPIAEDGAFLGAMRLKGPPLLIWARDDDVGLIWELPVEPVLPSLISIAEEPLLGGEYPEPPPEPESGKGICSHPIAARGYLCRTMPNSRCPYPQEDAQEEEGDDDDDNDDGDQPLELTIKLSACERAPFMEVIPGDGVGPTAATVRQTEHGPNICGIGGWRIPTEPDGDTPDVDPDLAAGNCSNCVVDLYCGNGNECAAGQTLPKQPSGRIPICINDDPPTQATYVILHELVHAQQRCNMAPGTPLEQETAADCCSLEYEPHLISCKAMADDGNFDGYDMTIEECALALSNISCSIFGENACTQVSYDQDFLSQLDEIMMRNEAEVPASCEEALQDPDGRILSIKESLKRSCRPGCTVEYENTIGNNLCYLGQCIEESLEEHKLIPGNIPFLTDDERAPWDSCAQADPQIAAITTIPPHTPSKIPTYRPRHMLQRVETAICQTNGFPRLSPPILCGTAANRRLGLPTEGYAEMIESLQTQQSETATNATSVEASLGNMATRFGAQLQNEYLNRAIRELADLVGAARKIVEQIGKVPFTKTMCPRNYTGEKEKGCFPFQYE